VSLGDYLLKDQVNEMYFYNFLFFYVIALFILICQYLFIGTIEYYILVLKLPLNTTSKN